MKTVIITGENREIDKILRENRRREAIGLIKIRESRRTPDTKKVEAPIKEE